MKKLYEKRAALLLSLNGMLEAAKAENRAFNDEENAEFERLESEIQAVSRTIQAEERARNIPDVVPDITPEQSDSDKKALEERAFRDYLAGRITEMRAGEQNVTMSNNGAVIPESIASRIIDEITELCPILQNADMYHSKGIVKIPKWTKSNTSHDVTVGYSQEFTELAADSGKFVSVDLGGFLAGSLVLVGKSVENNAAVDIVGFVIRKIAEKSVAFIEGELLGGTGTNAAQGVLNTTNSVTAAKTNEISYDELIDLQGAIKQPFQKNACWTMNPKTFNAIKKLKDTNGRPLIEPDATKEFPYTLLGKPVYTSDNMPELGAGAKTVLYGDYSGLSVNFREDISIEVLREKYATQHALGVVAWFEFDSRISDEQKLAVLVQKAS